MLGLIMLIAAVIFMIRVADMEGRSPVIWGAVTFGACILSGMVIPFPFVNIVVGGLMAFLAMFVAKALTE